MKRFKISNSAPRPDWTEQLRSLKKQDLRKRHKGDLTSAVISAYAYAKEYGSPMYVYLGNSYGHRVWGVTEDLNRYALCPISNNGGRLFEIRPDGEAIEHALELPKVGEAVTA